LVGIGRILRSHGTTGEVKLRIFERGHVDLAVVKSVFIGKEGEAEEYRIESSRASGRDFIVKLEGVNSLSRADGLAGAAVSILESAFLSLEEGQYYLFELEGCRVVSVTGEEIGTVTDVLLLGASSLLVVDRRGKEVLIPFHESICKEVDLAAKEIRVDLPAGLLDLNES
jgi:16S rRNA processing protein RimM